MSADNVKETIHAMINDQQRLWDGLASRATPELIEVPLNDSWTFGSLAKHLVAWNDVSLERLEAIAAGRELPPLPFPEEWSGDEMNAAFRERDATADPQAAITAFSAAFNRYHAVVDALPDSALVDPDFFPDLEGKSMYELAAAGEYFHHLPVEHAPEIEAWNNLTANKDGDV